MVEQNVQGVSNGPQHPGDPSSTTPAPTSAATSPNAPLFDEQQVRHFHELFSQAPWQYPGGQMMMPQLPMQPPLARPLFLEHEERRLQGQRNIGEQPPVFDPYVQSPGFHENAELRRNLEMMMEEKNQKLKGRLEALERPRQEDEPKFSTPDAINKEIEISKEAARPQSAYLGCQSPKEAARPPPQNPGQAETTKEAADPPGQRAKGGGDSSFTEKSMEFMALMMESMKEMQKRMNEGKEETGVVRGVETIRSGSPDLPLLAAWEPQQGPLILGDWLLLVEPIVADLSLFTGASFAPGSEESHGSFVVLLGSSPVFWRSGRQGFVTLSTAEAELTDIIDGMVAGESIHVILQEVFPDVPKVLKTDNMPALSILTGDGGSWRTRHLRLRPAYARQSVSAGEWTLQHVPGELMVADIGTKPLTAARFEFLKVCMGMGEVWK